MSASPVVCPPVAAPPAAADAVAVAANAAPAAAPPRKRRRRAPATGAAHDCFTCRRRHLKCDRRRPYCSQCLETSKECSGYKTQLTWGVGVASRGKLRGLSLPVAQKPATTSTSKESDAKNASSTSNKETGRNNKRSASAADSPTPQPKTLSVKNNITTYDFVNIDPTGSPTMSDMQSPVMSRPSPTFFEHMGVPRHPGESIYTHRRPRHNLLRLNTPLVGTLDDYGLSTSASSMSGSISGLSDGDMPSPIDYPQTPEDVSFMFPPCPSYSTLPSQSTMPQGMQSSHLGPRAPTSIPEQYILSSSISSNSSSEQSHYEFPENNRMQPEQMAQCNMSEMMYDNDVRGGGTPTNDDIDLSFGYRLVHPAQYNPPASPYLFDM
ncbi:MAG: hypothetical protein M1833_007186 [Piccolia ochrophora]|nr:MAG: hypothetical protein M1833_007186 [Piccolia ochrophora]